MHHQLHVDFWLYVYYKVRMATGEYKNNIICYKNESIAIIIPNQPSPLKPSMLQLQHSTVVLSPEFHHIITRRQLGGRLCVPSWIL